MFTVPVASDLAFEVCLLRLSKRVFFAAALAGADLFPSNDSLSSDSTRGCMLSTNTLRSAALFPIDATLMALPRGSTFSFIEDARVVDLTLVKSMRLSRGLRGGVPVTSYRDSPPRLKERFSDTSADGMLLALVCFFRLPLRPLPSSMESSSDDPYCEKSGNARRRAEELIWNSCSDGRGSSCVAVSCTRLAQSHGLFVYDTYHNVSVRVQTRWMKQSCDYDCAHLNEPSL